MTRSALFVPGTACALLLSSLSLYAQTPQQSARTQYEQDRQNCLSHNTQESKATCLREAAAAYQAARSGQLTTPDPGSRNALQRCSVFKTELDQLACVARVKDGVVSGSVAGGGVLRESITTVIIDPQ
jgi:hypothetical protein